MKLLTSVAMLGLVQVMLANEGATNVTNSNSQNSHSFLDAIMKKSSLPKQDSQNIASPTAISPLKQFGPPALINPNIALGYYLENQFDRTNRASYYNVLDPINNSPDIFHFSAGYFGYGDYESVLLRTREDNAYAVLNAHRSNANEYKDGNSQKIKFGYDRVGANFVLGYVFNPLNEIKFSFLYDDIDDDKQPHHTMDAIKTQRYVSCLNYRLGLENLANTLNFDLAYIDLSRQADNYSLRQNNNMKMKMKVDRKIFDSGLKYDISFLDFHNLFGVGYKHDKHIAKRYGKAPNAGEFSFNGYRFPGVKSDQISLYDTISYSINFQNKLSLGVEYDYNKAKIEHLNDAIKMGAKTITPHDIWKSHYGDSFNGSVKKDALSIAAKYKYTPNHNQSYTISLESLERIPSNEERFVSLSSPNNAQGQGWASNPNLNPERRNRLKAQISFKDDNFIRYMESKYDQNAWSVGATLVADRADDFIILDRARGQEGTNRADKSGDVISRNIDATLYSASLNASYNFLEKFGLKGSLYYNYGENRSDDRPLYQIAPLEAIINLDYSDYVSFGRYSIGLATRAVASQNRGDFDSKTGLGIDRKVSGFAIYDIYGSLAFSENFGLKFGVNNILDKEYAEYISGAHVEVVTPTNVVHAPGRNFYITLNGKF